MRKSRILAMVMLCIMLLIISVPLGLYAKEFSDVPVTATYYKAVDKLSDMGVVQGRGNDIFGPTEATSRAEFCAFLARANGYDESDGIVCNIPFPDVPKNHWAAGYISFCYDNGYINGMLDGTFCPSDTVTCEQAVKMVVCSTGVGDESLSKVGPKWYSGYINRAEKYNLLDNAKVVVASSAPRSFVAQVVYNSIRTAAEIEADKPKPTPTPTPKPTLKPTPTPKPTPKPTPIPIVRDPSKLLVVIDPGHNYSVVDTGAVGDGIREQDITFYIAEKLKPLLEKKGFTVLMTRNKLKENVSEVSTNASLKRRAEIANEVKADLFVSIHCNAGGGTGTETYYFKDSAEGELLATCIQNRLTDIVGLTDRGVKSAGFAVLSQTNMTASLVETAFIDSELDAEILSSDYGQQDFAKAIAMGICDYFGIVY